MAGNIRIKETKILSDDFFPLKKVTFEIAKADGTKTELTREVYQSANGVTALLYNRKVRTVVLTRQFRMPTYLNNNASGMMIEACAGIVEAGENPDDSIRREIEEEMGYSIETPVKIFDLFSTPGSIGERIHYYVAAYTKADREGEGGGLAEEQEDIEVMEMPFEEAYSKIQNGEINDAKTVVLLQYARIHIFPVEG